MSSLKPFRGLRYVPSRVEMAAVVVPSTASDPRHVRQLLDDVSAPGDGKNAALRRARLRLAEWQRAGILKRDEQPAIYAVRRRHDDGREAIGLFAALAVEGAAATADPSREARLDALGVAVEPVVATFDEKRVARALENAVDREADASWKLDGWSYELWCVDEESTTARITTLLSTTTLSIERGTEALAAHAAWWKKRPAVDDDRARAGAFALAFLHPQGDSWSDVPVGAALAPLAGALE